MGKPKIIKTVSTRAVNSQYIPVISSAVENFGQLLKVFDKNRDKQISLQYLDGMVDGDKGEVRAYLDTFILYDFLYPHQYQLLRDRLSADKVGITLSDKELSAAKDISGVISLDIVAKMVAAKIGIMLVVKPPQQIN